MAEIAGRAAFVQLLIDEGVTHLFGNPGTTELPIMQALPNFPQLQYVLGLHESVVVAMADGFCRACNRLAAANVHVAPGLGNAMGALYNAKFSSSPIILTAGQQEQGFGLTEPLLYDPLVPMAEPLVKWAVDVTRVQDLPRVMHRAATIALTPPTGPVFISLPGDVLNDSADLDLGRPTRIELATRPSDATLERMATMLLEAQTPVILAGHELSMRDAFSEAAELAELLGAAVYQQPIQYTAQFPTEHVTCMGSFTRNQKLVREILEPHDLLFCLGADLLRMSVYSPVDPLPGHLKVVHLSERPGELGKNYPTDLAVQANSKETLQALIPLIRKRRSAKQAEAAAKRLEELKARNWSAQRKSAAISAMRHAETAPIHPHYLVLKLCEALPEDAVVVEEALISTLSLPTFLPLRDPQRLYGLSSGGLGFAVPGAVGVSLALPGRPVAAVIGDGSSMYGVQGLWTAAHLKLPITYIICNNRSYRIIKERLVAMQGSDRFIGMDLRDPEIDFLHLAQSFGLAARRVNEPDDIVPVLREAFASGAPNLVDIRVADGFGA